MIKNGARQQFEINCACHGFRVHQNIWNPKLKQILQAEQKLRNVHDHFALSLEAIIRGNLTNFEIVENIHHEISRFCHYFINYTIWRIRDSYFGTSSSVVFQKMENFTKEYYLEPDKICPKEDVEKDEHFKDVFIPYTEEV